MARTVYCWRCHMDIPMLDEAEWREIAPLMTFESKQEALDRYQQFTGFEETVFNAIWHHRLSLYGPPCPHCGKPLRSPKAKWCAACGLPEPVKTDVDAAPSAKAFAGALERDNKNAHDTTFSGTQINRISSNAPTQRSWLKLVLVGLVIFGIASWMAENEYNTSVFGKCISRLAPSVDDPRKVEKWIQDYCLQQHNRKR